MDLKLLTPLKVGETKLANRVVMAPLTRCRTAEPDNVPTELNAEYYAQRATAGLIISEATQISRSGQGYAGSAGIYTDAQEAGWKKVVDAVHAKGVKMSAQLCHVGRISHSYFQPDGKAPVAPSAIAAEGAKCNIIVDGQHKFVPCDTPRELSVGEIGQIVDQYRNSAARAVRAGFDFVEEHAANGYLLQQFQATNTNKRTDRYGGSLVNRARLTLEVLDAMLEVVDREKLGVRISPYFNINGIADAEPEQMALYLADEFHKRGIAYLSIAEPSWVGGIELTDTFKRKIRETFSGTLIYAGEYTPEKAEAAIQSGLADAIAFGRLFIANPDLVERIRQNGPYNVPDRATFYTEGSRGYTDYPFLNV